MAQLLSTLAALLALTGAASSLPSTIEPRIPDTCLEDPYEYAEGVEVSDPYFGDAESVGGMSCPAGEKGGCTHTKTYTHTVGISYGVNGGFSGTLEIAKIFTLGLDAGFSVT